MKSGPVLELNDDFKSYGRNFVFRGASVTLSRGAIIGLVGANGSGKTVLLNMLSALDHPDAGTIRINGADTANCPPYKVARLGVARTFQTPRLAPRLTVGEHLVLATRLGFSELIRSVAVPARPRLQSHPAVANLARFGLEASLKTPIGQLSFGQQKIVESIAALFSATDILLMDEPTAGLSAVAKVEMAELLGRWLTTQRIAIVAEHDISFLSMISDLTAIVSDGYISVSKGSPPSFYGNGKLPNNPHS
jgi:ABC-type branched-subunit amino acid transport system ATPase component